MSKNKKLDGSEILMIILIITALLAPVVGWVVKSHFESKIYNKLTGANTTTWEAMWVELRVQDSPK